MSSGVDNGDSASLPQRDAAVDETPPPRFSDGEQTLFNEAININITNNGNSFVVGESLVFTSPHLAQTVSVLALVLLLALIANAVALPVILFRRTKFGNGLFAVLILCLTISDVAVVFFSVLGSLVMEVSKMLWGGAPGSCQVCKKACPLFLSSFFLHALI